MLGHSDDRLGIRHMFKSEDLFIYEDLWSFIRHEISQFNQD